MPWVKLDQFAELFEKVSNILADFKIKCLCGYLLEESDLTFRCESGEYWIFAHCPNCEYDLNHEKIYRQYKYQKELLRIKPFDKAEYNF